MPAIVERIRKAIHREHPGMAKSRTYAIATSAAKKKLGIRGHTTEGEMMRAAHEKTAQGRPGFGGGPYAAGPGGKCVCTSCGHEQEHVAGESCRSKKCPKCGASMARKGFEKVSAFEEGFYDELEKIGKAKTKKELTWAYRHPVASPLLIHPAFAPLEIKGIAAGRGVLEKAPWSVRHPLLTTAGGGVGGAVLGSLLGGALAGHLGKDVKTGITAGGQVGGGLGALGGGIYSGVKGRRFLQQHSR